MGNNSNGKKTNSFTLVTRILCGVLALLLVGGGAYYAIALIFEMFA